MRDYKAEFKNRVDFIRMVLSSSGAEGIVFGNSGGKDSGVTRIIFWLTALQAYQSSK